jgi:endogenous inhibitor of DNA gyrase (YacG/DUF329 family)
MSNTIKPGIENSKPNARILPCPTCQKPTLWSHSNPARPFCTERCKLIDLGAWSSGEHVIPGEPVVRFDDSENIDF